MSSIAAGFASSNVILPTYSAHVMDYWQAANWTGDAATPFQRREWLNALYAAADNDAEITPLVATICDSDGRLALRLPLIQCWRKKLLVVEFADLGLTDYNAPLLGPAAPRNAKEAQACWRALRKALPKADLLSLQRMPTLLGNMRNPFSRLSGAHESTANGNLLVVGEDWDVFRHTWERTFRKELERSWRVFERQASTRFHVVQNADDALKVLQAMETQQRERMQEIGAVYHLDQPIEAEFYRRLVRDNIASGYVVLTALMADEEIVAALLGIRDGGRYIMIRICHQGEPWSNCSPGRLVIERTMAHLHAQGCRLFDFSVGNYAYKRRFGVELIPLLDFTAALGWRGIPEMARARLAAKTRRYPKLHARIRKLLGR
jgi:CelD/BcsL family acetyltransferase involved in cellulose biosynthesis